MNKTIFAALQTIRSIGAIRPILAVLFFVSGFCGLVYQVVWTRMAFASFGITTPVLSVVLSIFMLGLAVGSALGGKWIPRLTAKTGLSGAVFYALAELFIGIGAFAVPELFALGQRVLLSAGEMNSFGYLFLSACVLAVSILPWCFFMGTTFPFMMAYLRESGVSDPQSFSFLYTANVLGAMTGTFLTAVVFVEMAGFHGTLQIAATGNFCIALVSMWLGRTRKSLVTASEDLKIPAAAAVDAARPGRSQTQRLQWILFTTGFCAMAMEVVWTRAFAPVLKTEVYSFAGIVFTYLGATFAGSMWYRYHLKQKSPWPIETVLAFLIVAAFLPIVAGDPRLVQMDWYSLYPRSVIYTLASICPFCAALGYLTPRLVDDYAGNDPKRAGSAYAVNVAGCIVGPLFASYILLPHMREKFALILLGLPFFVFYVGGWKALPSWQRAFSGFAACGIGIYSLFFSHDFQEMAAARSVRMEARRDYAASVVALESPDAGKSLLVNGIGMTRLTPITKYMADLPLAFHEGKPQSILVICFGMGTTYRTALSWDIDTTAVELIPDVPRVFGFYHSDAAEVLSNPKGRVVIDDGRRFLKRTRAQYDVIVIDPPPPMQAAGVSLLYSTAMYDLVKQHLKPHGILQVWYPGGTDQLTAQAVLRSAMISFPHGRCFVSISGWGLHILASMDPIARRTPAQLLAQMPDAAKKDLLEWSSTGDLTKDLGTVLSREVPPDALLNPNPDIKITDDDPLNEYFLLRRAQEDLAKHGHTPGN